MSYEVYAVIYGDSPEVWSLYASREMAEKDIEQHEGHEGHGGTPLVVKPMQVWEESDRIAEELVKEE